MFVWHKSLGVIVLSSVILRFGWRLANSPPVSPGNLRAWETRLASIGHSLLYVLMFAVPLSGWWIADTTKLPFHWFKVVTMPDLLPADSDMHNLAKATHGWLTKVFLVIIAVHIAAAVRHHFWLKNDVLVRMLPSWLRRERN